MTTHLPDDHPSTNMTASNIEISNDFFHDAGDLLQRYRLTVDQFFAVKSKRMKLFIDLRMAAECILKAYAAYFLMAGKSREECIREVEGYRHDVQKMAGKVKAEAEAEVWQAFDPFVVQLAALPVGLRYQLDGADFRAVNEDFYYETVGSDTWLQLLHHAIKGLYDALNARLVQHSKVVSIIDIWEELTQPRHNKFNKKPNPDA